MPRIVLLGEDRAHRQFLTGLCARSGWPIADEEFAPPGQGAASGWVLARFGELYAEVCRYPDLALLACIDGDGRTYAERRRQFLRHLARAQPEVKSLAILIPCWAIDTWALFFADGVSLGETGATAKQAKQRAAHLFRCRPHTALAPGVPHGTPSPPTFLPDKLAALVDGFLGAARDAALPALDDSRTSFRRL